MLIRFVTDKS